MSGKTNIKKIKRFFDFRTNADTVKTINKNMHENVNINIDNVLILASAIMIASIGLNLGSIPVIIGAMLISPLMGPLITLSYSLVIKNNKLLNKSLERLLIYVVVAVVISTIYFKLTFIKDPTDEIISRTNPTVFDLLIAIFGGIAGVIGFTRREKTNVIPGVAIATALMPPLCTIGYGIANFKLTYIINASILFITNAYFIVLTAVVVLFLMRFNKIDDIELERENKIKRVTLTIFVIVLVGTLFNTYLMLSKANVQRNLQGYIDDNINQKYQLIIDTNIDYNNEQIIFTATKDLKKNQKTDLKEYISEQKYIENFDTKVDYEKIENL